MVCLGSQYRLEEKPARVVRLGKGDPGPAQPRYITTLDNIKCNINILSRLCLHTAVLLLRQDRSGPERAEGDDGTKYTSRSSWSELERV